MTMAMMMLMPLPRRCTTSERWSRRRWASSNTSTTGRGLRTFRSATSPAKHDQGAELANGRDKDVVIFRLPDAVTAALALGRALRGGHLRRPDADGRRCGRRRDCRSRSARRGGHLQRRDADGNPVRPTLMGVPCGRR